MRNVIERNPFSGNHTLLIDRPDIDLSFPQSRFLPNGVKPNDHSWTFDSRFNPGCVAKPMCIWCVNADSWPGHA